MRYTQYMTTGTHVTPKDFFLWAGAMATLYVSVVSFLALVFNYINYLFPDPLEAYATDPYSAGMRFAMASLIVVFPLYLFLTRILNEDIRHNSEKKDLWVRRWFIFLTLFVAGITLAIDLVVLINGYLGGELTTRFALKSLAVLIVVGAGFLYYFFDLKGRWEENEGQSKLIGLIAALVVVGSVVGSFSVIGSPAAQRLFRADEQRVGDLQGIQWQLVNYWQQKEVLPQNLSELEDPISGFVVPQDKETGASYEYRTTGKFSFELCATFNKESRNIRSNASITKLTGIEGETWQHGVGRYCFTRTIDPERYPPYPKGR